MLTEFSLFKTYSSALHEPYRPVDNCKECVSLPRLLLNSMNELGISMEKVKNAIETFGMQSADSLCHILLIDQETFKTNHIFVPLKNSSSDCKYCPFEEEYHFTFEQYKTVDSPRNQEIRQKIQRHLYKYKSSITLESSSFRESTFTKRSSELFETGLYTLETIMWGHYKGLDEAVHINPLTEPSACQICSCSKTVKLQCSHFFCEECLSRTIKLCIDSNRANKVKCPMEYCSSMISTRLIASHLDFAYQEKYVRLKNSLNKQSQIASVQVPCYAVDCEDYVELSDTQYVTCYHHHTYCVYCKEDCSVNDCNCSKALLEENERICPFCNSLLVDSSADVKLKCALCKNIFCWICLESPGKHHYSKLNLFGCAPTRKSLILIRI